MLTLSQTEENIPKSPRRFLALLVVLLVVNGACGGQTGTTEQTVGTIGEHHDSIAWFEGDTDAAFALAKGEGKPLFLYWGAEWCPPCHYLKNKIFKRPEFVAKTRDFVPVYLDGDTESAQILGDELGVMGYPTVMIFSPDGVEVMRMPNSIPVEEYADVLDTAMQNMRPVKDTLATVMEVGPAGADPADLNQLAFYSWMQDSTVELEEDERLATFKSLYEETSDDLKLEKSRFLSLYLGTLIDRSQEDEAAPLDTEQRAALSEEVMALLDNDELVRNNLFLVFYASRETAELLHPEASPDRDALVGKWVEAAQKIEGDTSLPVDDRLDAIVPQIELAKLESAEDEEIPVELQDHVRERIAWAAETVTDDGELQGVLNSMGGLFMDAGLEAEAEVLLTQMMSKTHAPYYFMSWIGSIKKEANQPEEAIAWYRKAYDNSRGRYSRFRWGSTYLRQAMDLRPDDVERIEADSLEILSELLTLDDAFAGGNYSRLESLGEAYQEWNEDGSHDESIARIRDFVHQACDRYPSGAASAQERCGTFLSEKDDTTA